MRETASSNIAATIAVKPPRERSWAVFFLLLVGVSTAQPLSSFGQAHDERLVSISIAGWGGNDRKIFDNLFNNVLVDDLAKLGVEIRYQPVESNFNQFILNALSSGDGPDVFYVDISMLDVFRTANALASFEKAEVPDGIVPQLVDAFTRDGNVYAIPKDYNAFAVFYNVDVFADAKVPVPAANESFSSLRGKLAAVRKALGKEGVYGACMPLDYTRLAPLLYETGWRPFSDDFKIVIDERFKSAFMQFVSLFQDDIVVIPTALGHSWPGGCLGAERAGIAIEGNWVVRYLHDKAPNLLFGAVEMPRSQRGSNNVLFTVGWGVNRNSPNIELAKRVVSLLSGKRVQEWVLGSSLALPSRADVLSASSQSSTPEDQAISAIFNAVNSGSAVPYSFAPYAQNWADPINEALASVVIGKMAPEKAFKRMQSQYNYRYEQMQQRLSANRKREAQ